jgi:hypothetical protein
MRSAFFAIVVLLAVGCEPQQQLPTSTALPQPIVALQSSVIRSDLVQLVWSVRDGDGRKFEVMRRNRQEPWKHFATIVPINRQIQIDDTAIVPGQTYTYRLRIYGVTNGSFLDEVVVDVPR